MEARPGGEGLQGGTGTQRGALHFEGFAITVHILRLLRVIGAVRLQATISGMKIGLASSEKLHQFWGKSTNNITAFNIWSRLPATVGWVFLVCRSLSQCATVVLFPFNTCTNI